ncbi:ribonuclease R [Sediminitomix flava]|uniref:Ribonuclease R n=1 Tax=Sediminitomix flava TaxID=379075 RepID=A0A315Z150_SEDFL|nr:ribonuclease R [Sediminitomix flava]PWJ36035.1 RNAse R [Sediminitomix flava]
MSQKKTKQKKRGKKEEGKINQQFLKDLLQLFDSDPDKSYTHKQLCKHFKIRSRTHKQDLQNILDELVKQDRLERPGRSYHSTKKQEVLVGIVDYVNPSYAYVIVEGLENDIVVSSRNLKRALDGDKVELKTFYNKRRNRIEGEVTRLIERKTTEFIGTLQINRTYAFVVTSGRRMHQDIFVYKDNLGGAENGDKVIVKMTQWKDKDKSPIGKIKKVLGKSGDNNTEIHSIMFEYGLPFEFPEEVEKEALAIPETISEEEISNRRDFRNRTTFTIDPLTAKDFDDAISIRKMKNGHWEIGIHIADVTHYVRPGTELEREAFERATSVYLVDRTVPMLPEKLSNGLCSLNPHVDRLAFAAVFEIDEEGKVHKQWFGRTAIHSDRRFTYEEAQERIESGEGDFAKEIITLNEIAKKMKVKRFKNGAISFESVELRFELDENGKPIGLFPKIRQDAHKLVEEFMLLANKRVAEYVFRKKENNKPVTMVYRTHEPPDPDKVTAFASFAKRFGYDIDTDGNKLASTLNHLASTVEGRPEQNIIESQAIRVMSKAKYSTTPEGHYGLGFAHYSHFTSPIRRYPDMMAHRLLQHYLDKGKSANAEDFDDKCLHSSQREKVAADAERASIKYKQVEFMSEFLGEEMEGVVSGITEWGMYVELKETRCEGMIRLTSIEDDMYIYDDETKEVVGQRYHNRYRIGDEVKVLVKTTNIEKRTIDFELLS